MCEVFVRIPCVWRGVGEELEVVDDEKRDMCIIFRGGGDRNIKSCMGDGVWNRCGKS